MGDASEATTDCVCCMLARARVVAANRCTHLRTHNSNRRAHLCAVLAHRLQQVRHHAVKVHRGDPVALNDGGVHTPQVLQLLAAHGHVEHGDLA
jgi:hypothetical protein